MSDYADFCRDMREHRREKKDQWRYGGGMKAEIEAAKILSEVVLVHSEEHLKLTIKTDRGLRDFDFWPSTGLWKSIGGKASGYGIKKLKSYLKL